MIAKLAPGMSNLTLLGKIISKADKRSVRTKYGKSFVCEAVIRDETGQAELTLWGDQIGKVKEGDEVEVVGAYVTEWQGEIKINVPKKGEIIKK